MQLRQYYLAKRYKNQTVWLERNPIRAELFGVERLEQHAASLAKAQEITTKPRSVLSLRDRLEQNATALITIYQNCVNDMEAGKEMVPAAEWLLDNYHIVEAQIQEIRQDLPTRFYKQLPKLASGPFAGYPRVFGLAWAFVAHTDSYFDPDNLRLFLAAYQRVQPLSIGELWAVPITLRFVLVENLCRLGAQIAREQLRRDQANILADRILHEKNTDKALAEYVQKHGHKHLSETFAAQLITRLRAQDPSTTPALRWLDKSLQQMNVSMDLIVEHIEQRQSSANVSIRNVITSMRLISDIDWAVLFEKVSLVDEQLRAYCNFAAMNFATRNLYRDAVEELARYSKYSELEVVDKLREITPTGEDPGFYLIGQQRPQFEQLLGFNVPFRLQLSRAIGYAGIGGFVTSVLTVSFLLIACAVYTLNQFTVLSVGWIVLFGAFALFPATEVAMSLLNRLIVWSFNPTILPGMTLQDGIPNEFRTLVAVPTLLTSTDDINTLVDRLEVHYLTSFHTSSKNLYFALITDWLDAKYEVNEDDRELLNYATAAIAKLNQRHPGNKFLLLHRRRTFNSCENVWMGWERKRGKLHELNQLLRGSKRTTFLHNQPSMAHLPENVRYVITLDSDTRLVNHTVIHLIGKMAHPLNRPHFDAAEGRITQGYGILQPRVTPSFPIARCRSLFQSIFSGPGGIDPYAAAASDLYQDLFHEGSYTGKGIYDVDAFESALQGRIPENILLSHDLFEGIYARAGLASDVEVVEDFPASYDVLIKRQHRWTRGDWQLLSWIFNLTLAPPKTGSQTVPLLGRFKMLDNLRRSLLAPFTFAAIVSCFVLPWPWAGVATAFVLISVVLPAVLPVLGSLLPRSNVSLRSYAYTVLGDIKLACWQVVLTIAFLPDHAWRMADAIGRTLVRLLVTHRHLLEWTTAAQVAAKPCKKIADFYREMLGSTLVSLSITMLGLLYAPSLWPLIVPLALLWLASPWLAYWSAKTRPIDKQVMNSEEADTLRLIARRTWRYFEEFVNTSTNMLPPDNFQETPEEVVAQRTSPTNIGVYLLSILAARDFGWIGFTQTIERFEETFASMRKMRRYRGHFLNWYATDTLAPLKPSYVSSVDSGNLAGHLIVVANACEEWLGAHEIESSAWLNGLYDNCLLAQHTLQKIHTSDPQIGAVLQNVITGIKTRTLLSLSSEDTQKLAKQLATLITPLADANPSEECVYWLQAIVQRIENHAKNMALPPASLLERVSAVAATAREFAMAMDFSFLIDPRRQLLSIGYSLESNTRDESCYDLLASEARLASLFAIAKGDAKSRHWFRLGRSSTPVLNGSALISWSGSMFEYLMPSLVMRAPSGSLLNNTIELAVKVQQQYARALNIPWGMSESAFNARDHEFTYQYSNFGVPELGLKRGLRSDQVVAPYATGLAALVDPSAAVTNYKNLTNLGALGRYGYYEAIDFTSSRTPENMPFAIVRSFMAHHQGMTIAAIANTLLTNIMCKRFHREPIIHAHELLLQERIPRNIADPHHLAATVKVPVRSNSTHTTNSRIMRVSQSTPLTTHLLSNGHYSVLLNATGGGQSRLRDIAVTRWRPDASMNTDGTFFFLRDLSSGRHWCIGAPADMYKDEQEAETTVEFAEDHAEFTHHHPEITSSMEVVVSMEDEGEVRRITLSNLTNKTKTIDITSYTELVLNTTAADQAHPAFNKMFVQTESLPEFNAIIATRRTPSLGQPQLWVAHLVVVEGTLAAAPEFASDRASFLGRGRTLASAICLEPEQSLANTAGTVLDPMFSLRRRVSIDGGNTARLAFWTLVAESREQILALLDKYHDRNAYTRVKTLAWTQAQLQLRHLSIDSNEAIDFQQLATPLLYPDAAYRSSAELIKNGAAPQSALWESGISGDLPIILLYINNITHIKRVQQLIRAHEYLQLKQLSVDLVIINEQPSSYIQELQDAIEAAVRSNTLRADISAPTRGAIYPIRADQISLNARKLLASICRVKLYAGAGSLRQQLNQMHLSKKSTPLEYTRIPSQQRADRVNDTNSLATKAAELNLEFFNGRGGFANQGREYITLLNPGETTPNPWLNVIANQHFGFQVSAEGSSYTWANNSRENQLTPWCNDPVSDTSGEMLYVRDENSMQVFTATANGSHALANSNTTHNADKHQPPPLYIAKHGFGYSQFQSHSQNLELELLQFVPLHDPIKISRLTLRNTGTTTRHLSVTAYVSWVLGNCRTSTAQFIQTELEPKGAILARNPWSLNFSRQVAFADLAGQQTSCTADRYEFIGRQLQQTATHLPHALTSKHPLSGRTGVSLDPCAALQQVLTIEPGESAEVVFLLGQGESAAHSRSLLKTYRQCDINELLHDVTKYWQTMHGSVQVKTPDRAADIMLNGWLIYQTLACRMWARSAFYQASGAYGFRDQLQDSMALTLHKPDETRAHILRAAARQFSEGDVQHWWLPESGIGVRTRIADDKVWLVYVTARYIQTTGDIAILDEQIPFLEGPTLGDEEHEQVFKPETSSNTESLFAHCALALDTSIAQSGKLGLPLIGTGDWNDGMNQVGAAGKGESVWLGWLLLKSIALFVPFAKAYDADRAQEWSKHSEVLRKQIEHVSWDGEWYRRATYDDGSWLGTANSTECRIDSIAQSWAVLSGFACPARAQHAMASLKNQLISKDDGLALLFTPPFNYGGKNPGYIQGYPPGLRENGGQYSHAAMWAVEAYAKLGDGNQATSLFTMLNPINHALNPAAVERYKVEPYAVAADIYSVSPHIGRGGWTWYTGAAGCMYRAGLEGILGIKRRANTLIIRPAIACSWPGYEVIMNINGNTHKIIVNNPLRRSHGISYAEIDGVAIEHNGNSIIIDLDEQPHEITVVM